MSQQLTLSSAASPRAASSRCRLTVSPAVTGQTFHVLYLRPAPNLSGIGLKSERKITKISLLLGKPRLARMNSESILHKLIDKLLFHVIFSCIYSTRHKYSDQNLKSAAASSAATSVSMCFYYTECFLCLFVSLGSSILCLVLCLFPLFLFVFLTIFVLTCSHHLLTCVCVCVSLPPCSAPWPHPFSCVFVRAHHVTVSCGSCMVLMMSSTLASRR